MRKQQWKIGISYCWKRKSWKTTVGNRHKLLLEKRKLENNSGK
jgi:hypothetical protein